MTKPIANATAPTPARKPKERTDAANAAHAFNKLDAIDKEEIAEFESFPASIKARHESRRQKVLAGLTAPVRELVERMRGKGDG